MELQVFDKSLACAAQANLNLNLNLNLIFFGL